MKIAFVTPEFLNNGRLHDGGLASYIYKITRALHISGHQSIVIMPGDENRDFEFEGIRVVMVKKKNIIENILNIITRGRLKRLWNWIFQSYALNQKLKSLHRTEKFDVVQFSSYKCVSLFATTSIPYTVRISSLQELWETDEKGIVPFSSRLVFKLEKYTLKKAQHVYGPGKFLADYITREIRPERPVQLLPTPALIRMEKEDNSTYEHWASQHSKPEYLLYFGTISILKGAEVLKELIPRLFSQTPSLHVVLIGKCSTSGPDSPLEKIRSAVPETENHRFHYFSSMPHAQLTPFIQHASFTIIPSRYDNFPNTALEAMQQGKIVFASDRASLDTLITRGGNGFICTFDRVDEYLNNIVNYLQLSETQKQEMSAKTRLAIQQFAPEKSAAALLQYFQNITNGTSV